MTYKSSYIHVHRDSLFRFFSLFLFLFRSLFLSRSRRASVLCAFFARSLSLFLFSPSFVPSIYASFFSSGDKRARKRERERERERKRRERGEATRILLSRSTLVSKYTRLSFMSTPRRKRAILRPCPPPLLPLVETDTTILASSRFKPSDQWSLSRQIIFQAR